MHGCVICSALLVQLLKVLDRGIKSRKNADMGTDTPNSLDRYDLRADSLAVARAISEGTVPDPEIVRRVRERAEKARLELLGTQGMQDMGVQLIREIRGALPES